MTLIDDLERILEWHNRHNTLVARLLQPGLAEAEIQSKSDRK